MMTTMMTKAMMIPMMIPIIAPIAIPSAPKTIAPNKVEQHIVNIISPFL